MEVFQTDRYYIFVNKDKSLWWNRTTSEFQLKAGWDLASVDDIECIGITLGIIGVISLPGVFEPHLIIIKESVPVGVLYTPNLVYKIKSICMLSDDEPDTVLLPCSKHQHQQHQQSAANKPPSQRSRLFESSHLVNKTWGVVKSAGSTIKNTTQQAAALATNQMKSNRDPSRIEKRIKDEFHRIFDESDSFFYCIDGDITNNLQRRSTRNDYDDRFFWNKYMLKDLFKLNDPSWILPIIQGFVQTEECVIGNDCFTLALVSRRSRYRAGTRYKRRGIDEDGNCANYVETEQILSFGQHQMSFTQVRGSVPVFWSQPGYKYRPPPRIDKAENETQIAFEKHFNKELSIYSSVCIINLVEQSGKEKLIYDAYGDHILKYNSERLIYITFDFHDYCRGMRFENVSALIDALAPEAGAMGFHWRDNKGPICSQKSIFRVNCMDCLDRTNVVQTAIGKAVLESQLVKLGLAPPYSPIPEQLKTPFMILWANNGDIISRQYAGTNALKGDYTRTGERKFTGLVKDGMNSANRYYLARFKDSYRQATIDLMLGNTVSAESLNALGGQVVPDENDALEGAEHARLLVEDCRRMLLGTAQYPIGSWGLIDADPNSGDPNELEVDNILLLTDDFYLVAEYDSHLDKIVRFEKVLLDNIVLIEFGLFQQTKIFQGPSVAHLCIRLNYMVDNTDGYFHMFRSPNIRFFNNVAVVIKTQDEVMESLMAIVEFFRIALHSRGKMDVEFQCGGTLQRRKSRNPLLEVSKGIPRNLSESQLLQIGTKALSNVAGQFTKLGQTLNPVKIRSGRKNRNNSNPHIVYNPSTGTSNIMIEQGIDCSGNTNDLTDGGNNSSSSNISNSNIEKPKFSVGHSIHRHRIHSNSSTSDSDENDCSIYEPDSNIGSGDGNSLLIQENPIYNENTFLPSVGIVMSTNDNTKQQQTAAQIVSKLENKDNFAKKSADVCTMSITSVTDHINMPIGMLESASPIRSRSPAPEIRITDDAAINKTDELVHNFSTPRGCSSSGTRSPNRDLSLNLTGSQSDNALKQLKTLTSPLSKIAKGMQNLGMNLDPRKMNTKTAVPIDTTTTPDESSTESERDKLHEKWDAVKCKTKLIAL